MKIKTIEEFDEALDSIMNLSALVMLPGTDENDILLDQEIETLRQAIKELLNNQKEKL